MDKVVAADDASQHQTWAVLEGSRKKLDSPLVRIRNERSGDGTPAKGCLSARDHAIDIRDADRLICLQK